MVKYFGLNIFQVNRYNEDNADWNSIGQSND